MIEVRRLEGRGPLAGPGSSPRETPGGRQGTGVMRMCLLLKFTASALEIYALYYEYIILEFFFPFIFISWRLITLQYCGGFCHTLT